MGNTTDTIKEGIKKTAGAVKRGAGRGQEHGRRGADR